MTKVYAKLDSNNVITEIDSDIFLQSTEGYTLINEGDGDKYAHAQGNYLPDSLTDSNGKYNYKLVNGTVTALTDEEKETLFPSPIPKPNELEQLISNQERTDQALQDLILMMMGGGE